MADVNATAAPASIKAYLDALKRCLKGQPPALIQDALADAEEYLRAEQAPDPAKNPKRRFLRASSKPMERHTKWPRSTSPWNKPLKAHSLPRRTTTPWSTAGPALFGVLVDPRAYGALIYMLLSLATGIFYFTWAVTGVSLSLGLAILIIGIPFALLFIGSIRVISWVEGRVVEALLGVRMPRRLPSQEEGGSIWSRIKRMLADGRTWGSLVLHDPAAAARHHLFHARGDAGRDARVRSSRAASTNSSTGKNVVRLDSYPELDALFSTPPRPGAAHHRRPDRHPLHAPRRPRHRLHPRQDRRSAPRARVSSDFLGRFQGPPSAAPFSLPRNPLKVATQQRASAMAKDKAEEPTNKISDKEYEQQLYDLQVQLVKFQRDLIGRGDKVCRRRRGPRRRRQGRHHQAHRRTHEPARDARRRARQAHRSRSHVMVLPALRAASAGRRRVRALQPLLVQPRRRRARDGLLQRRPNTTPSCRKRRSSKRCSCAPTSSS